LLLALVATVVTTVCDLGVDLVGGLGELGGSFVLDIGDVSVLVSGESDDLDTGVGEEDTVFALGHSPVAGLLVRVVVAELRGLDLPVELVGHAGLRFLNSLSGSLELALVSVLSLVATLLLGSTIALLGRPVLSLWAGGGKGEEGDENCQLEHV
jgi:hypothetical protein